MRTRKTGVTVDLIVSDDFSAETIIDYLVCEGIFAVAGSYPPDDPTFGLNHKATATRITVKDGRRKQVWPE